MSLLITNGRIVTSTDDYVADVYCDEGTIKVIGRNLPAHRFQADRTIDASGKYVIPGGIDVHTHLNCRSAGRRPPTISSPGRSPPHSAARPASSTSRSSIAARR